MANSFVLIDSGVFKASLRQVAELWPTAAPFIVNKYKLCNPRSLTASRHLLSGRIIGGHIIVASMLKSEEVNWTLLWHAKVVFNSEFSDIIKLYFVISRN